MEESPGHCDRRQPPMFIFTTLALSALLVAMLVASVCGGSEDTEASHQHSLLDNPAGPTFTPVEQEAQIKAGAALLNTITSSFHTGDEVFKVPPGDYRWPVPDTPQDVWVATLANLIRSWDAPTFTVDASLSTFWFDARPQPSPHVTRGFKILNCSNIIIKGLTIDWGTQSSIEGVVTQIDASNNRIQLELSNGSTFRPWPDLISPNIGRIIPFKSNGNFIVPAYSFQSSGGLVLANWTNTTSSNRFWIHFKSPEFLNVTTSKPWRALYGPYGYVEPGDGVAVLYSVGTALSLDRSANVTVQNVNLYGSKTFVEEMLGDGGHRFENVYFGRRPGTNRLLGGEGVMSNACRRGSSWNNITMGPTTDDMFNFHGYWGFVHDVVGTTITFEYSSFTVRSSGAVRVGDRIIAYDNRTMEEIGIGSIVSVMNPTGLVLDIDLSQHSKNCVIEFPDTGNSGWSVRNSFFHDAYQRVFVQSGPGTFINNTMVRIGSSISVRSTILSGNEGGVPRGIKIAGNKMINMSMNALPDQYGGTSSSAVSIGKFAEVSAVYKNISVHDNLITRSAGSEVFARSVQQLTISGNTLVQPCFQADILDPGAKPGWRQAVYLTEASTVSVSNNSLLDPTHSCKMDTVSQSTVLGIGANTSDVTLDGRLLHNTTQQ